MTELSLTCRNLEIRGMKPICKESDGLKRGKSSQSYHHPSVLMFFCCCFWVGLFTLIITFCQKMDGGGFFVLEATSIFYIKCMMRSGNCSQELSASTPPVKVTELNFLVPVCSSFSQKILSVRLVLNIPLTMTHQHGREFDRQKDSRLFFCLRWTISIVFKSSQLLPTFLVMPNKTQCRSLLLF